MRKLFGLKTLIKGMHELFEVGLWEFFDFVEELGEDELEVVTEEGAVDFRRDPLFEDDLEIFDVLQHHIHDLVHFPHLLNLFSLPFSFGILLLIFTPIAQYHLYLK